MGFILFCCGFFLNVSQNHDGNICLYLDHVEGEHGKIKHLAGKRNVHLYLFIGAASDLWNIPLN